MSRKCDLCGKRSFIGRSRSHALNSSLKVWQPNLQYTTVTTQNGDKRRVKVTARCLKTLKKNGMKINS